MNQSNVCVPVRKLEGATDIAREIIIILFEESPGEEYASKEEFIKIHQCFFPGTYIGRDVTLKELQRSYQWYIQDYVENYKIWRKQRAPGTSPQILIRVLSKSSS